MADQEQWFPDTVAERAVSDWQKPEYIDPFYLLTIGQQAFNRKGTLFAGLMDYEDEARAARFGG